MQGTLVGIWEYRVFLYDCAYTHMSFFFQTEKMHLDKETDEEARPSGVIRPFAEINNL